MAGNRRGLVDAIRYDVQILYESWMELFFPRQRGVSDTVLGKWSPESPREQITYTAWSTLGVPVIALLYPLLLTGYFIRFQARRLGATAARLGLFGVIALFVLTWGGLVAVVWLRFSESFTDVEVAAIAAAAGAATFASALSYATARAAGRGTTVTLAYPFAMTAIFLPPVVAAVFHPALEDLIIARSDELAQSAFEASPTTVQELLAPIDRQTAHHVLIWFAASFPVGWLLGLLVTLANVVRPSS